MKTLSRLFIERSINAVVVIGMLLLAGCAADGIERPQVQPGPTQTVVRAVVEPSTPPGALTLYEQAAAVMAAGDYTEAQRRFEEFVNRYPNYPGAYVNLAIIDMHANDDAAAESSLNAALRLNPDHPGALNQRGLLYRKNGNFPEAEAAYLKAVTANPDYALAHYNLGVLNELYLQRLDVALHHFEKYQALVGDDKQVEKWIADLRRRIAAAGRTANVAD